MGSGENQGESVSEAFGSLQRCILPLSQLLVDLQQQVPPLVPSQSPSPLLSTALRMRRATSPLATQTRSAQERSRAMLRQGSSGGRTPMLGEEPSIMWLMDLDSGLLFESFPPSSEDHRPTIKYDYVENYNLIKRY